MFFLVLLAFSVLHFKTVMSLVFFWWNSYTYDYGLLVAPISVYLIWKKWPFLIGQQSQVSIIGISLLLFANLIWFLAFLVDVQTITQIAFVAILSTLIMACAGKSGLMLMRFPLLYLSIAIPIWDPLRVVLQNITVSIVSHWLDLVDIPSYVKGIYIQIPEGEFMIATTCAGLRYFLASMALFSLYSHLYYKKFKTMALFLTVSLFLAVMVNWVRVFIVIVAGHLTNMQHFLVHDHADFGWLLFALTIIPLFIFGNHLQKRESRIIT